ncbi:hypothetical protein [Actinoallomurus rhizosphaericola]|uniref:hypothetical protein n=1 Tax=Actinoallomurus rhizosphaericola TaxID=2952536 RepID=UPI0020918B73|nr:hypothetical protein [Actinoallomurus rhizosphaericola]MCO5992295.1 hypothetical protein [Actinoallomurus rhizosphaericola]
MELDAGSRSPAKKAGWHRLHYPVAVFLIVFGATRIASLLDWSGRHRDAARLLGAGDGTVTALLGASAAGELLLTVAAILAVSRRRDVWLLVGLAGWSVESLALAIVAGVAGDTSRLVEHGAFLLVFAGLLAVTYRWSAATRASAAPGDPDAALSSAHLALAPLTPAPASPATPDAPPAPSATVAPAKDPAFAFAPPPHPSATLASPPERPATPAPPQDAPATRVSPQDPPAARPAADPSATRAEVAPAPKPVSRPPSGDVTRRDLRVRRPGADGEHAGESDDARPKAKAPESDARPKTQVPKAEVPESDVTRRDGTRIPSDVTRRDLRMAENESDGETSAAENRGTDDSGLTRSDMPLDSRDTPMRPRGAEPSDDAEPNADETMFDRNG